MCTVPLRSRDSGAGKPPVSSRSLESRELTRWVCWCQRRPGAPGQQRGAVVAANQRGDVLVVVNGPRLRRRWRAIDDACARRRAGVVDGRRALRGVSGRRRRHWPRSGPRRSLRRCERGLPACSSFSVVVDERRRQLSRAPVLHQRRYAARFNSSGGPRRTSDGVRHDNDWWGRWSL